MNYKYKGFDIDFTEIDDWVAVERYKGGDHAFGQRWAGQMRKKHKGCVILRARSFPDHKGPLYCYVKKEIPMNRAGFRADQDRILKWDHPDSFIFTFPWATRDENDGFPDDLIIENFEEMAQAMMEHETQFSDLREKQERQMIRAYFRHHPDHWPRNSFLTQMHLENTYPEIYEEHRASFWELSSEEYCRLAMEHEFFEECLKGSEDNWGAHATCIEDWVPLAEWGRVTSTCQSKKNRGCG